MAHQHSIYDTDPHFKIDGFTMAITDQSEKPTRLMKDDHNSQRITFEIDRYLDGHDVLTCNRIEVHFINIDAATKETNADVYKVEDVSESPDSDKVAIFSWLVSKAATKYAGTLNFRIRFACVDENGVEQYAKHTDIFKGMLVGDGYNNAETVVNNYSDILTEWETKFINLINANALTVTNTTESTEDGGENVMTFSDGSRLIVKNGRQGTPGADGKDGKDGTDYILTKADKADIVRMVIESLGGNPIYGYIDENYHLVLSGNMPDGTYTASYEDENGSIVSLIGRLTKDTNTYYSVTNNLTNCTSNNSATEAIGGKSYSAVITANSGYELKSVSVTMGGSPVSVTDGVINIASVTGDIVITAVAEEKQVLPPVTENLTLEAKTSITTDAGATRDNTAGHCTTPYIDVSNIPKPCTIQLTGAGWANVDQSYAGGYIRFYIEDVNGVKLAGAATTSSKMPDGVTMTNGTVDSGNGTQYVDVTITVTSDNIGKLRFAGCYTTVTPTAFDANVTKATLTYTPNS